MQKKLAEQDEVPVKSKKKNHITSDSVASETASVLLQSLVNFAFKFILSVAADFSLL